MLKINSSSQSAEIDATMNSSLPLVKYGLPNGGYCSSTSDLCQVISGLPCCDHALIRIFSLIKKKMKMKLRSITSTPTAQADSGEAHNKVRYKTNDYNVMLKYLFSYKSLASATDVTLSAWCLISPQYEELDYFIHIRLCDSCNMRATSAYLKNRPFRSGATVWYGQYLKLQFEQSASLCISRNRIGQKNLFKITVKKKSPIRNGLKQPY